MRLSRCSVNPHGGLLVCTSTLKAFRNLSGVAAGQGQDRMLSPALAESVLRALLSSVPPARFQHLMRIIRNDYFMLLDPRAMCR